MKTEAKSKGPWIHRFTIHLLTIALGILLFWLLGFLVKDIRKIRGPEYSGIEEKHLDKKIMPKRESLEKQIAELTQKIENHNEKQRIIGVSSQNLQQTINQLLELQKMGIQKNISFSETEQTNLTNSLNLFLENQKKYQELNQSISELVNLKQELAGEKDAVLKEIEKQKRPARAEYNLLMRNHRLNLAFIQLLILLPILGISAYLFLKKRGSLYIPIFTAFAFAALFRVTLVIHEYFPKEYFKYVLITAIIIVVMRIMIYFIRMIAFQKGKWLLRQYREAYERFLCPVCEYPIRTGPRKYLFWTRRTVNKIVVPGNHEAPEESYTCPSCGNILFEECVSCHKTRHALLPHCAHCGAEKDAEKHFTATENTQST